MMKKSTPRHLFRSGLFLLFFVVLLVYGCKTTKTVHKISLNMHPLMESQVNPSGEALIFEKEGIWGAVRPVSYEGWAVLSSLNSEWDFKNPFEGIYDEYGMPLVLYLVLENRSDSAITFNPSASFSLLYGSEPLFPIEYDDLYQDLYGVRGGSSRLERIKQMLFRSYQTLQPGEQERGMLLFRRPDAWKLKSKDIIFLIRRIYVGKREIDFTIPFQMEVEKIKLPSTGKGEQAPGSPVWYD